MGGGSAQDAGQGSTDFMSIMLVLVVVVLWLVAGGHGPPQTDQNTQCSAPSTHAPCLLVLEPGCANLRCQAPSFHKQVVACKHGHGGRVEALGQ
jgi:hypothetical protein